MTIIISNNDLYHFQQPYSILDLTPTFTSRGEKGLLEKVKLVQPKVHLFGHIHASYGKKENPKRDTGTETKTSRGIKKEQRKKMKNQMVFLGMD